MQNGNGGQPSGLGESQQAKMRGLDPGQQRHCVLKVSRFPSKNYFDRHIDLDFFKKNKMAEVTSILLEVQLL